MNVTQLFTQVNAAYRGSDDDAPTTGTDFNLWLATANRKQAEWYTDQKQVWKSLFSYEKPVEPGTVATTAGVTLTGTNTYFTDYNVGDMITVSGETVRTIASIASDSVLTVTVAFANTASTLTYRHTTIIQSGIRSYALHRSLSNPSDQMIAVLTTGDSYVQIVKPQTRAYYDNDVYIAGRNPTRLHFTNGVSATSNTQLIGATLKVPGYYYPADLTTGTDTITVDDPYWLVYSVASELAFNDITYADKAPDINNKANSLYDRMVQNNRRGTANNPRVAQTNVNRIINPNNEYGYGGRSN